MRANNTPQFDFLSRTEENSLDSGAPKNQEQYKHTIILTFPSGRLKVADVKWFKFCEDTYIIFHCFWTYQKNRDEGEVQRHQINLLGKFREVS